MLKEEYISPELINNLFGLLNRNQINYVLLRNINEELPNRLSYLKDIDVIIDPNDKDKIISIFKRGNWLNVVHPWDFGNNFVFLYSMDKFLMFSKEGLNLDVCFQMCCRSLNAGEWIPLDEVIQHSVFENKLKVIGKPWHYQLSIEDEIIHLVTRCVFDKKTFPDGYINRISELLQKANTPLLEKKIQRVFFGFTDKLMNMLADKDYQNIRNYYLSFTKY